MPNVIVLSGFMLSVVVSFWIVLQTLLAYSQKSFMRINVLCLTGTTIKKAEEQAGSLDMR